jgi:L-alanine-DL-glutamate epimerase-like enolase superfamily enzyme
VLDEAGCVQVPQSPGLGIELDEDDLQEVMARPWQTQRG